MQQILSVRNVKFSKISETLLQHFIYVTFARKVDPTVQS